MEPLDPEPAALLAEIVDAAVRGRALAEHDVQRRVREAQAPWWLDELVESGRVGTIASGHLYPTVTGCPPELQADVREVARRLSQLADGDVELSAVIRAGSPLDPARIQLALAVLLASGAPVSGRGAAVGPKKVVTNGMLAWFHRTFPAPVSAPAEDGPVVVRARAFRGLAELAWTIPEGLSVLTGTNGAGKTSALEALAVLRDAFDSGPTRAIAGQLGVEGLRRLGSDGEVVLGVARGTVSWELGLAVTPTGLQEWPREEIKVGDTLTLRRGQGTSTWYLDGERMADDQPRTAFRAAWERGSRAQWRPLRELVVNYRKHGAYAIEQVRRGGGSSLDNARLTDAGENLVHVLRNWKAAERRFGDRYGWVVETAREAFPGLFDALEFLEPVSGLVPTYLTLPGNAGSLPFHRAAHGLVVGLLHLTAAAGVPEGGLVAIDEFENQLHPHAIRTLLRAIGRRAEDHRLRVVVTTHSPVVLDAFADAPDRIAVLEPGRVPAPIPLVEMFDRDWLALGEVGELYVQNKFGTRRA